MILLVTGGSGSGKSEYAEGEILALGKRRRIYVATMRPWDEECERRILRHHELRAGKGFETVECYGNLEEAEWSERAEFPGQAGQPEQPGRPEQSGRPEVNAAATGAQSEQPMAVLVECMSNLVSNVMFGDGGTFSPQNSKNTVDSVFRGICHLKNQAADLIIVTNEVFSDGTVYDPATAAYQEVLGEINQKLAGIADRVVEVVVGIPVVIKGG